MKALLVVDLQNDFCTGGALEVKDGEEIVPLINSLMPLFPLTVASMDWHPEGSVHFEKWPPHCVRQTDGADFAKDLNTSFIRKVFLKGTESRDDGYSAFEATNMDLANYLKSNGVDELYITGLATDYCVKASALDALKNGFKTYVIYDAVKAVNANDGDEDKAFDEMITSGVVMIHSSEIQNPRKGCSCCQR